MTMRTALLNRILKIIQRLYVYVFYIKYSYFEQTLSSFLQICYEGRPLDGQKISLSPHSIKIMSRAVSGNSGFILAKIIDYILLRIKMFILSREHYKIECNIKCIENILANNYRRFWNRRQSCIYFLNFWSSLLFEFFQVFFSSLY